MSKRLNVLLAEDDLISRRLIKILITKMGHHVEVVDNGRKAVEKIEKNDFDMVLMDVQMPVMDGLEATKIIRGREEKGEMERLPIIAVTAHAMKGDKEKCLQSGMDDYITKPIDEEQLKDKIDYLSKNPVQPKRNEDELRLDKLYELLNNEEDVSEIIGEFLDYFPEQLDLIRQMKSDQAYQKLRQIVHKFKGSVSNFQASKIMETCREIEAVLDKKDCKIDGDDEKQLEEKIAILEKQVNALAGKLRKLLK